MKKTMFIGCLAAMLAACSVNPWKAAEGPDEKAYAVLGTYKAFQKQALKVAQDQTLPRTVRLAVADADAAAVPVLVELDKAVDTYLDAKALLDAGKSTEEKVTIALTSLVDWTKKGRAIVDALKKAVTKARGSPPAASTTAPFHPLLRSA